MHLEDTSTIAKLCLGVNLEIIVEWLDTLADRSAPRRVPGGVSGNSVTST